MKREQKTKTQSRRTAEEWLTEISEGLEYRRLFGLDQAWTDLEAKFYSVSPTCDTGPNIVFSKGDALVASLSVPEGYVMVSALSERSAPDAPAVEALANQVVSDVELQDVLDDALVYAYLMGVGPLKFGFDSEFGYDPDFKLGEVGGTLTQFDDEGHAIESGVARTGRVWCEAVDPRDVVVPWGTRLLSRADWIAHRVVRSVDDVKADPKYVGTAGLEGTVSRKAVTMGYSHTRDSATEPLPEDGTSEDTSFVELWEIMDRRSRRVIVICVNAADEDGDTSGSAQRKDVRIIRDEVNEDQQGGQLPWADVCLTHRTRAWWVTPLSYYQRPHQIESDDIHAQAKEQRRASVLKFLARKGTFTETQKEAFLNGKVGMFVEVDANNFGDGPLADSVIVTGANPTINTLLHLESESVESGARETIGMSKMAAGEFDEKNRRTAYEVSRVEQGSDVRLGRKQQKVRRTFVRSVEILLRLLAAHWTTSDAVRVTGDDGAARWEKISAETLQDGRFSYKVSFSTEHFSSPSQRQQQALLLYGQLMNDPRVDQSGILENVVAAFNMPQLRTIGVGRMKGTENAAVQVPVSKGASARGAPSGRSELGPPAL